MSTTPEFADPRLVAIYDSVNVYAANAQPGFYGQLAAELDAVSVVDLGCGTGVITCELARQGFRVIGIDPSPRCSRSPGAARAAIACPGSKATPPSSTLRKPI